MRVIVRLVAETFLHGSFFSLPQYLLYITISAPVEFILETKLTYAFNPVVHIRNLHSSHAPASWTSVQDDGAGTRDNVSHNVY